ncbi:MAG: VOC family protein, partial [Myxococcota bacterium]
RTHGLTHISLSVADPEASLAFYQRLLGVREYFRDERAIQVLGPGPHDVLVFERRPGHGVRGGIDHFGFRLTRPEDVEEARREAEAAGGKILRQGEHAPGEPYLYVADPDGNEIEIWFEPDSAAAETDPAPQASKAR